MAVNASKANDPRFWARWRKNGATQTIVPMENPSTGCHIINYAEQMVKLARQLNEGHQREIYGLTRIEGSFNEIKLYATHRSTVESVIAEFHAGLEKQSKEYEESYAGKTAHRRKIEEFQNCQKTADLLISQLGSLDFDNHEIILNWICAFQKCVDRIGVKTDIVSVISALEAHGYRANMNCGPDFKEDDKVNFAEWIIGQAINCLVKMKTIHQIFHHFTKQWKESFLLSAA